MTASVTIQTNSIYSLVKVSASLCIHLTRLECGFATHQHQQVGKVSVVRCVLHRINNFNTREIIISISMFILSIERLIEKLQPNQWMSETKVNTLITKLCLNHFETELH